MTSHPAHAITVYPESGPSKDYVRVEEDGGTLWAPGSQRHGYGPSNICFQVD